MYKRRGKRFANAMVQDEDSAKSKNSAGGGNVTEWLGLCVLVVFALVCLFFIQRQAQMEKIQYRGENLRKTNFRFRGHRKL